MSIDNFPSPEELERLKSEVTAKFFEHYDEDQSLYHPGVVKRVFEETEYKFVERFLERERYDVKHTLEMIKHTLKWFTDEGLFNIEDNFFPSIFYQLGIKYIYGVDREGNTVVHIRGRLVVDVHPQVHFYFKKFLCYTILKALQMSAKNNKGWTLCFDLTGMSFKQFSMQDVFWAINLATHHLPSGLRHIIFYNVHFMLKPIVKTALALLPKFFRHSTHILNEGDLFTLIAPENLPKYLGGTNPEDTRRIPDNCPTFEKFCEQHCKLSHKEIYREQKLLETLIASNIY